MIELKNKFNRNFNDWSNLENNLLDKTFLCLHSIAEIGEILRAKQSSKHHEVCCRIYDEIFSDAVSSLYLAACAIDKPANIILRRVLELGVAAIYLWDMPHITYSWREYNQDLSFSEMLSHVNSQGYIAYVADENEASMDDEIFPSDTCKKIYNELSDIIHGKLTSFESLLPDRFSFIENDWIKFVELTEKVLEILVKAYLSRHSISKELFEKLPQARKEFS